MARTRSNGVFWWLVACRVLSALWAGGCEDDLGDGDVPSDRATSPSAAGTATDAGPHSSLDAAADDLSASMDAPDPCEPVMADVLLTCGSIVCHDPFSGGVGTLLDLSTPDGLPDSLFGLRSSPDCGEVPYVNPERPGQSLLLLKLDDTPPCGDRMPGGDRPPLDAEQLACFTAWVEQAAELAGSQQTGS